MGVLRVHAVVVLVAVVVVVPGGGLREGPDHLSSSDYLPSEECESIRLTSPDNATAVRKSVLRQMCFRAALHVDVTNTFKQFAVFLLHRDDFDPSIKWHSGHAKDVLSDRYWAVNEVKLLQETKYLWYAHGLPWWPLPHQALHNTTSPKRPSLIKKKPVDWPNYGLATPIYFASKAWRDQTWSVEEFFQQERKKAPFKNHEAFHKLVKEVVAGVNGTRVESYSEWPFLKHSLPPMVRSMTQRNKGICPDEMYIYLRLTPCFPATPANATCSQPAQHASLLLDAAACPDTKVIVGYSKEYNEAEGVLPL